MLFLLENFALKNKEKIPNKFNSYYEKKICYLFCYLGIEIIRSDNTLGILTIIFKKI